VYIPGWVERTALLSGLLMLPAVRPDAAPGLGDPLALVAGSQR
jgi:hypothetical protein